MNKLIKRKLIIGASLDAITMGSLAYAGGKCDKGEGYHGRHHGDKMEMLQKKLTLTDEQVAAIKEIKQLDHAGSKQTARHERKAIFQAMKALNPNDSDYAEKIQQLAGDSGEKVRLRIIQHGNMQTEIYKILTPQQQQEMTELMQKHHENRGSHKARQ